MATSRTRRTRRTEPFVRAFEDGDAETVVRLLGAPHEPLRELRRRWGGTDPSARALVVQVGDEVVGFGTLHAPARTRARWVGEIAVMLHDHAPDAAGETLLSALVDLAEGWLGILRLQTTVPVDDKRAIALLRDHGFGIEGVARAATLRHGTLVDVFYVARVADDLPWRRLTAEDVAQRPPPQLTSGRRRGGNGHGNANRPTGFGWGFGTD